MHDRWKKFHSCHQSIRSTIHTCVTDAVLCVGIRFNLIDITGPVGSPSCKTEVKMRTSEKSKGFQDTISAVFGYSFLSGLCNFKLDLEEIVDKEYERRKMICSRSINGIGNGHGNGKKDGTKKKSIWRIEGMVARAPGVETKGGKNIAREIQFFSVNGRPVELPRASRIISDVWRNFESSGEASRKRPACILGVYIPNSMYDINVSPDKRDVIISNESIIYDALRDALMELWSKQSGGNFRANEVEQASNSNSNGGSTSHCSSTTLSGQKRPIASRETERLPQGGSVPSVPAKLPTVEQESDDKKEKMERRNAFVNHFTNVGERNTDDTVRRRSLIDIASAKQVAAQSHDGSNGLTQSNSSVNARTSIGNDFVASPSAPEPKRMRFSRRGSTIQSFSMEQRNWNQTKIELNPPESRSQQEQIDAIQSQSSQTKMNDSRVRTDQPQAGSDVTNQNTSASADKASITKNRQSSSTRRPVAQKQSSLETLQQFAHGNNNGTRACTNKAATRITSPPKSPSEFESESSSTATSLSEDGRANGNPITTRKRTAGRMSSTPVKKRQTIIHMADDEIDDSDQEMKSDGSFSKEEKKIDSQKAADNETHSSVDNEQSSLRQKVMWEGFDTTSVIKKSRAVGISCAERKKRLKQMKAERINESSKTAECQEEKDQLSLQSNKASTVSLSKEDFVQMRVIGQFNLGFLLALGMDGHLWILDQHACDEIYNFEKLCKETKIHEQKLIAPLPLELSPSEENCVVEHMDVFESNGFRFSYDGTKPPRHRLCLTALPHSGSGGDGRKAVQFGPEDVGALCGMLGADGASSSSGFIAGSGTGADGSGSMGNNAVRRHAGAGGAIVRLPKAVAMFASRACRRSVMIGDHLSQKQMEDIITKLRKADQPWNCPHGRPTIRHVTDLLEGLLEDEKDATKRVTAGPNMAFMSQE